MHRFAHRPSEACVKVRHLLPLASLAVALFLAVILPASAQQPDRPPIDPKTYAGMQYRLIGPFRRGRARAVTGGASQPNTYYFGAVAGGVWKTTDGGISWDPIFDKQTTSSIGSVAVSHS